jgi:adenosylcobinamide-GDP ribazoletransferase
VTAVRGLVAAIGFFTRIPTGGRAQVDDLPAALPWMPLLGLLFGGLGAALALLAGSRARLCAVLIIALWAALSGGLHLDGLADVCDALGSSRRGAEAQRILKDPHVGAYAVIGVVLVLLLQVEAAATVLARGRADAILCAPLVARVVPLAALKLLPAPAHVTGGLGFHARTADWRLVAGACALAILAALLLGPAVAALSAIGVGLLAAFAIARPLGGVTGDVCGAAIELASAAYLVAASSG